jgi:hypothetical protein
MDIGRVYSAFESAGFYSYHSTRKGLHEFSLITDNLVIDAYMSAIKPKKIYWDVRISSNDFYNNLGWIFISAQYTEIEHLIPNDIKDCFIYIMDAL